MNDPDARLIAPARDGAPNIWFPMDLRRECRIWQGYLDASLILLRKALEGGPWVHNLIFPALFNLRHAMEVALKWHIEYAGGAIPRGAGHDLDTLIDAFRRTADDLDEETSYVADDTLDRVSELASIDPRSVTFRYATELDGTPIQIGPERWDLRNLYVAVDVLSLWFDSLSGWIDLSRNEEYQAYLQAHVQNSR
jgi:hypothetical protein